MERPTPRVTKDMLPECSGKTVRIVGKVNQVEGETAKVDSNGSFDMHLTVVRFIYFTIGFQNFFILSN